MAASSRPSHPADDELFPEHNSKVAKVIVSEISNSDELIKEFKKVDSGFNIAISVDMMDTGIDVPSVMNLVFAKPVYSRAKFWQMTAIFRTSLYVVTNFPMPVNRR